MTAPKRRGYDLEREPPIPRFVWVTRSAGDAPKADAPLVRYEKALRQIAASTLDLGSRAIAERALYGPPTEED